MQMASCRSLDVLKERPWRSRRLSADNNSSLIVRVKIKLYTASSKTNPYKLVSLFSPEIVFCLKNSTTVKTQLSIFSLRFTSDFDELVSQVFYSHVGTSFDKTFGRRVSSNMSFG